MKNKTQQAAKADPPVSGLSVQGIIKRARGSLTQQGFVEFLRVKHRLKTSQGLISKYEKGQANPPAEFINKCIAIIHSENTEDDISLKDLEARLRKVLYGPTHASARKAFAVILDSLT